MKSDYSPGKRLNNRDIKFFLTLTSEKGVGVRLPVFSENVKTTTHVHGAKKRKRYSIN